jgi:hypothetical protein
LENQALPSDRFRARNGDSRNGGRHNAPAVALDGPVRGSLDLIDEYRVAERNLTRLLGLKIGKPGQSNAPVGRRLNEETNICAGAILKLVEIAPAVHRHPIHERSIVEAFPTSFLGLMLANPISVMSTRTKRSDVFYKALVEDGTLKRLFEFLLPHRTIDSELSLVTNHDDRATLICAITAMATAACKYCCVGDSKNGWIVLPPQEFIRPWAHEMLNEYGKADLSYHQCF